MKTVLVALEQLNIGGVETFSLCQIKELSKKGYKCIVLARDGVLSKKINKIPNVKIINFNYKLKQYISNSDIKKVDIMLSNEKIDFAIVHQYPCAMYLLPFLLKNNIPYYAYIHSIIPGTFTWFTAHYPVFNRVFKIYFENASKIVGITNKVVEENKLLFNISDSKYVVCKNAIDLCDTEKLIDSKINYPFKKYMLITRFAKEKIPSIDTALNFFNKSIIKDNQNALLDVYGDGDVLNTYINKYKDNKNIIFKRAIKSIYDVIGKYDVVLGVDRCILEALASKKIAIICGYNGNKIFVNDSNIDQAYNSNFSGNNMGDDLNCFNELNPKLIDKIIKDNFNYVKKNCVIDVSLFNDTKKITYGNVIYDDLIFEYNTYLNIDKLQKKNKELFITTQKLYKTINEKDILLTNHAKEIESLKQENEELKNIIESKKIKNKIKRIIKKK